MSGQAKTVGVSDKMKAKDYITLGIFTVLFFAVVMVCIFASAATVVTFAFGSAIAAIPGGIIYMLMRAKVPKAGSVLLSGVVIGLIEFLIGAGWAVAVGFIAGAVIAELYCRCRNCGAAGPRRPLQELLAEYHWLFRLYDVLCTGHLSSYGHHDRLCG